MGGYGDGVCLPAEPFMLPIPDLDGYANYGYLDLDPAHPFDAAGGGRQYFAGDNSSMVPKP